MKRGRSQILGAAEALRRVRLLFVLFHYDATLRQLFDDIIIGHVLDVDLFSERLLFDFELALDDFAVVIVDIVLVVWQVADLWLDRVNVHLWHRLYTLQPDILQIVGLFTI